MLLYVKKRVKHPKMTPWMTQHLLIQMNIRDQLKESNLLDEYKAQRNFVSSQVEKTKKDYFNKLVTDKKDTAAIWRAINTITRKNDTKSPNSAADITPDSFNTHFLSLAQNIIQSAHSPQTPTDYVCPPALTSFCQERLGNNTTFNIPLIAEHEVGKYITNLKNKKTMGLDNVPAFLLKIALPYITESLTYVYNLCIKTNVFPHAFKNAKIFPLPKTKDSCNPNDFRPISLLSVLSKPLERHMHTHLSLFMEKHELFHPFQSGFRSHHSCHTALSKMCDNWLSGLNQSKIVGAVFLDFQKAFDLVDHSILLNKLSVYLRSSSTLSFLQSYLEKRTQRVFHNGKTSTEGSIKCGVPQGSVLGPLLFCIFINDLPLHVSDENVTNDLFADDSSLQTSGNNLQTVKTSLPKSVNEVSDWCKSNSMTIHLGKTKSMTIATRQKHQLNPLQLNLDLGGICIEQVHEHRVLGVIIDDQLNWQSHLNNVCKTVSKNIFLLSQLKRYLNTTALKLFFNSHIMSHINYSSTIWDGCSNANKKRLNSLHRRAAKLLLTDSSITTDDKLRTLDILPLDKQLTFNKATFVFKATKNTLPNYINCLFTRPSTKCGSHRFLLPQTRIDLYKSSLAFSGPSVWNSIPVAIKNNSLQYFKKHLHKHLISL
jgi:hypothetical protein